MLAAQSCWTHDHMDCSPPGFSVHGILQTRILEWVAIPFFRGSSWSRDRTQAPWIIGTFCTTEPPGKPSGKLFLKQIEGEKEAASNCFRETHWINYNFACACSVRLLFSFFVPSFLNSHFLSTAGWYSGFFSLCLELCWFNLLDKIFPGPIFFPL